MNLSKEQVSNLTLLADFMEGLDDPNFTMAIYQHSCGAPACALGWACTLPRFRRLGLSWEKNDSWKKIFGDDVHYLLFSHTLQHRIRTPQQWAAHCRAFLKENGCEVTKSDGFEKFMKKVTEPVQFCPVNSNGEWA